MEYHAKYKGTAILRYRCYTKTMEKYDIIKSVKYCHGFNHASISVNYLSSN